MKFTFILALIIFSINVQPIYSQIKINPCDTFISQFVNDSELINASVSICIKELSTGETLGQYNPSLLLAPASTLKLFTTAAALETFGPNYQFNTSIGYSGTIDHAGLLNGNLIIRGGGDPCFYSKNFPEIYYKPDVFETITQAVKKAGITKINGRVIGSSTYYKDNLVPQVWITGDVANYYGAAPDALSFMDNEYSLFIKTGTKAGDSTRVLKTEPQIPELQLVNKSTTSNIEGDESVLLGGPFSSIRWLTGELPTNKSKFEVRGAVPDPAGMAACYLYNSLKNSGIDVMLGYSADPDYNGKVVQYNEDITGLMQFPSPYLYDIIKVTNLKSMNLYAEHLVRQLGIKFYNEGSNNAGTRALAEFWKNISGKMILTDGSGLSRFDAVSASQLVAVLSYMKNSTNYQYFYNSLPVAGRSGSIAGMFKSSFAENNLRAKSGYMSGVRSYAGYVTTQSGKMLAFAVIVNNYTGRAFAVKSKIEQLLIRVTRL